MANIKQSFERVYVPDREVDSLVNKLDDERFLLLFTPRKPKSGWSTIEHRQKARARDGPSRHPEPQGRFPNQKPAAC
jgi:hypothetical protein